MPDLSNLTIVQEVFAGIIAILVSASMITFFLKRKAGDDRYDELSARVKSWWMMIGVFGVAISLSLSVAISFLALVSFLALKEYFSAVPTRRIDRLPLLFCYLAIPAQFYFVYIAWYGMFILFIPLYMFLLTPLLMLIGQQPRGFLHAAGTMHWGLMLSVFSLSHAAYLLVLPADVNGDAGPAGLLLFLIGLTQLNDVLQYVWGKILGETKIIPKISPGKTVAGCLGGIGSTALIAWQLGPMLTPLTPIESLIAGAIIGGTGFLGDLNVSAVKRDLGIKDMGATIPGHGGIFDRIDSLTFTAPIFFHYLYYLHY